MTLSRPLLLLVATLGVFALLPTAGFGQQPSLVSLYFDENCHGAIFFNPPGTPVGLPCAATRDPGPGGLANPIFYGMLNPPNMVGGDVLVLENADLVSDILRFDSTFNGGGIFVYSDFEPGVPPTDLADVGLPLTLNQNVLRVLEVGPEGQNGITYTPLPGQPGFVPGFAVTYNFTSDAPEPATAGFLLIGGAVLAVQIRRRAQRAS